MSGVLSITLTSADVTLTQVNGGTGSGSTNPANLILDCSGTLTDNVNIIAPSVGKMYIVRNGCTQSASETVSIKTSGGSALEIPNAEVWMVWCDGTDFFSITALPSGTIALASNALALGGVSASAFPQLITKNNFNKPQSGASNVRALTALAYAPDADTDQMILIAQAGLTGDITIENVTGSKDNGQELVFFIEQHATTPVSVIWDTDYTFPDTVDLDLTQTINKIDVFWFKFNSTVQRWLCVNSAQNFARTT